MSLLSDMITVLTNRSSGLAFPLSLFLFLFFFYSSHSHPVVQAKQKYEKEERRKELKRQRGEDTWMLPEINQRLQEIEDVRCKVIHSELCCVVNLQRFMMMSHLYTLNIVVYDSIIKHLSSSSLLSHYH